MSAVLDWYGCATFRLQTQGLTVFLDAYIDRAANADGPGLTADDIDTADWILVGHSHFDHLYGAERIAAKTGATIIGSYETVRVMEQAGVPLGQMICVGGGETIDLSKGEAGQGVRVKVYPSLHSCVWSHAEMSGSGDVCIGDLGVLWHERQERFGKLIEYLGTELAPEAIEHLTSSMQGDRGDGGALVYVIETPDGSVLYQDTSGHWSGMLDAERYDQPDVAILAAAGRGNVDGEPFQGSLAQFVGKQVDQLQPQRVVLGHHDNWLPGFSVETDVGPIRDELAKVAPAVELLEFGYLSGTEILPISR